MLEVERLMDLAAEQERFYKKQLRTYRNWETAWLLMNTKPDDLEEYVDLKVWSFLAAGREQGTQGGGVDCWLHVGPWLLCLPLSPSLSDPGF